MMRHALPTALALAALLSCASDDASRAGDRSDAATSGTAQVATPASQAGGTAMKDSFRDTAAFATLLKAEYFEYPWVGRQMEPSRNAVAFEELMSRADAGEAMAELFNAEHPPQVRLYGLCGLYFTDHANFRDHCNDLSRMRVTVDCLKGDLLLTGQALSTLIRADEGEPVLTFADPDRAVSQWKSRVAGLAEGHALDIQRGGLPTGLRVAGRGGRP